MIRDPQVVLSGDISLIEPPLNDMYRFQVDVVQRLKEKPDINPVAIYGIIAYNRVSEMLINESMNASYQNVFQGTRSRIKSQVREIVNEYILDNSLDS
ncbi:hypothetical protein MKZ26_03140 [Sporosarcina sp. FSL K6-6792]|uniref:hypothetical protein n=1 Tax=Sporosarcina sp. FSL K6-6792 TaxID=2921559 RepID=UPI0030FB5087